MFEERGKSKDPVRRREALSDLGRRSHPLIADRLLRIATGDEPPDLREAAFRTLALQGGEAARAAPRVAAWLVAEERASRKALARGDFGLPVDRRSGEPILDGEEGRAALEEKRARGRARAAAVDLLRAWEFRSDACGEALRHFLQDGSDALAVAVLRTLSDWRDPRFLPDILALFRMYPAPNRWETGVVIDISGTDASARAKWMAVYGDPEKRRPRPAVHEAIRSAAERITGEACATPGALEALIASPKREPAGRR